MFCLLKNKVLVRGFRVKHSLAMLEFNQENYKVIFFLPDFVLSFNEITKKDFNIRKIQFNFIQIVQYFWIQSGMHVFIEHCCELFVAIFFSIKKEQSMNRNQRLQNLKTIITCNKSMVCLQSLTVWTISLLSIFVVLLDIFCHNRPAQI